MTNDRLESPLPRGRCPDRRYSKGYKMKRLTLRGLFAVALFGFSFPVSAQVHDIYVLPAIISQAGAGGTQWSSEIHMFNPQPHRLWITLVYIPSGGGPGLTLEPFPLESQMTAYAEDVLRDVFEIEGRGSLLIAAFAEDNTHVQDDPLVRSFIANGKNANTTSFGTYGVSMPGVSSGLQDYFTDGISAVSAGVHNYGVIGASGYRAAVGAVNLGRYSTTLIVSVYDAEGDVLVDQKSFFLPPQGHIQDALPSLVEHGSVEFYVDDPTDSAVVFPYVTVVDNRTGDGIHIDPVLIADPADLLTKGKTVNAAGSIGTRVSATIARDLRDAARRLSTRIGVAGGRLVVQ